MHVISGRVVDGDHCVSLGIPLEAIFFGEFQVDLFYDKDEVGADSNVETLEQFIFRTERK